MSKDRTPEELRTAENLIRRLKTWSVRQNFFELNQRERTLIEALCSDAIRTERIRSAEPVTEEQLRKNDGYIHVGNGCEIAVRGTTEKLKALESCLQSQAEVMEKMREALEFAGKKREFEGTPRMIMNKALDALKEIAKRAKEALSRLEKKDGD